MATVSAAGVLAAAKRVVVKVGSNLLIDAADVRADWLGALADEIAALRARDVEVLVVSSGAIGLGRRDMGLPPKGRLKLEEAQAAAAVGQIRLSHAWQEALSARGLGVAQVLLTLDDSEDRRRYLNARGTLTTLLSHGRIPVINENDTVATSEIRFGDNDRLAARVATMAGADVLVLLSDVDGLYTADPTTDPAAAHIPEVAALTAEIEAMAGATQTDLGTGGMVTKLRAAKVATQAGCALVIADGRAPGPLARLAGGARATLFHAGATPRAARKAWIATGLASQGALVLDAGATRALARGKSLLPAGIVEVRGPFQRGDAVDVIGPDGARLGRGLVAYDSHDADRIKGRRSAEIEALVGHRGRDEMIHRDDLVLDAQAQADHP